MPLLKDYHLEAIHKSCQVKLPYSPPVWKKSYLQNIKEHVTEMPKDQKLACESSEGEKCN